MPIIIPIYTIKTIPERIPSPSAVEKMIIERQKNNTINIIEIIESDFTNLGNDFKFIRINRYILEFSYREYLKF